MLIALRAAHDNCNYVIPQRVFDLFPALYIAAPSAQRRVVAGATAATGAGVLVLQPRLLILNEPTEGMSPWLEEEIDNLIRRLNRNDELAILLLEQHVSLICRMADYFLLLHRGAKWHRGAWRSWMTSQLTHDCQQAAKMQNITIRAARRGLLRQRHISSTVSLLGNIAEPGELPQQWRRNTLAQ